MPRPSRTLLVAGTVATLAMAFSAASLSPVAAAGHAVSIRDDSYTPRRITIKVGDSITWTNKGSAIHNVYFDGFHSDDAMKPGDQFAHKFRTTGSFTYVCTIHGFNGTVVVNGASLTPKPTPEPSEKPTASGTAAPAAASPSPSSEAVASIPGAAPSSADGGPITPQSSGASSTGPLLPLLALLVAAGVVALGVGRNRRRR